MNIAFKKFVIYSLVASFVLLMGTALVSAFANNQLNTAPVYFVVPFVMIITIIFHSYLLQATKGDAKAFIPKFMASSGIKLMLYLAVIVFYIVWYERDVKVFLTSFLISYIVFTFIEVVFILSHIKK
jgi:hypothetical protein